MKGRLPNAEHRESNKAIRACTASRLRIRTNPTLRSTISGRALDITGLI